MGYNFRENYEKEREEQKKKNDFSTSLSNFLDKVLKVTEKIVYSVINFIAKH